MTREEMQMVRCEAINAENEKIRNCYTSLAKKIIEEVLMPAFQREQEVDKTNAELSIVVFADWEGYCVLPIKGHLEQFKKRHYEGKEKGFNYQVLWECYVCSDENKENYGIAIWDKLNFVDRRHCVYEIQMKLI